MKPLLFEQSKAAPRRGQAWSCLRGTPVSAGTVQVRLEKKRGDVERNRRCISERDSCCTCQRPFCAAVTTLGSRCTCAHTHTLAGVKRCQLHLWPPAVKGHRLTARASDRSVVFPEESAAGGLQVTFLEPQTATGLRCDSLETCTLPYAERRSGSAGSERRPRKTWSVFTPIQVSFKPRLTPLCA